MIRKRLLVGILLILLLLSGCQGTEEVPVQEAEVEETVKDSEVEKTKQGAEEAAKVEKTELERLNQAIVEMKALKSFRQKTKMMMEIDFKTPEGEEENQVTAMLQAMMSSIAVEMEWTFEGLNLEVPNDQSNLLGAGITTAEIAGQRMSWEFYIAEGVFYMTDGEDGLVGVALEEAGDQWNPNQANMNIYLPEELKEEDFVTTKATYLHDGVEKMGTKFSLQLDEQRIQEMIQQDPNVKKTQEEQNLSIEEYSLEDVVNEYYLSDENTIDKIFFRVTLVPNEQGAEQPFQGMTYVMEMEILDQNQAKANLPDLSQAKMKPIDEMIDD